ncbi:hypothetical protein CISIN_1g0228182mg, partial [Citrus sinensis]
VLVDNEDFLKELQSE